MNIPPEITFRDIEKTEAMENFIYEKLAKLERVCDHIHSCRIAVEKPHKHQRTGQPFRVRIDLRVPPGHEVVITRDSRSGDIHDELRSVIRDAFSAAGRKLKSLVEKQARNTKRHPQQETNAFVSDIFRDESYGFLKNLQNRDIYFHKNSVLQDDFDRLEIGTGVRYVEEEGEKGPQASTVQIIDKPGARIKENP